MQENFTSGLPIMMTRQIDFATKFISQVHMTQAVIRECFKRLYSEGIEFAYITGYSPEAKNLYNKLGAVKCRGWYKFTLNI